MNNRQFAVWLGLLAPCACAQTIDISSRQVQYDQRPLILHSAYGELTTDQSLRLCNRTAKAVLVELHSPATLAFVYFRNQLGDYEQTVRFWLAPRTRFSVPILVYPPRRGTPTVYGAQLIVSVSFGNAQTVLGTLFTPVDLSVYLYNAVKKNRNVVPDKPPGYDVITIDGKPARFDTTDFPLRVYSNHRLVKGQDYERLIRRSLCLWNAVAASMGLNRPFFEYVDKPTQADIEIDWSGTDLSSRSIGMAKLEQVGSELFTVGIVMRPPGSNATGETVETLCQELCHLLGVDHSSVAEDIMNGTAHAHWHDLAQVQLTERDRQILVWLYGQNPYSRMRK